MVTGSPRWYTAPPLPPSYALTGWILTFQLVGNPTAVLGQDVAPTALEAEAPLPALGPDLTDEVSALRDDLGALWVQVDRLTDGEKAPPWATEQHERLDRRLERLTILLERLSARIEDPVPRLDEPLTLLTLSLCTLVLGFVAGRSLQRRSHRKNSRFGL